MSPSADPPRLVNTRRFLMSLSANELDAAVHLLSDRVTYSVPGRSSLAGVFHGPTEVRNHLERLLRYAKDTYDVLKWIDWMVGETHVAALQYAQMQGNGRIYRGHNLFLVETDADDKLSVIRVFFEDQEAATRFFID